MPRIVRNTLLNYIPTDFATEQTINPLRIFELNNKPIRNGEIIYLCEREIRVKDNFALQFALQKSKELNLPLKIIHPKINYNYQQKQEFIDNQIEQAKTQFRNIGLDFEIIEKRIRTNKYFILLGLLFAWTFVWLPQISKFIYFNF